MGSLVRRRAPPLWVWLLALFAASFALIHAWSGESPALWVDTLNDDREVRQCVLHHTCSLLGQSASIEGLFVAGGWLDVRAVWFSLGLGLEAVHGLLQALDALGVVLVAIAGLRLGGRLLAAGAPVVLLCQLGRTAMARQAINNTSPMAFLGAVMLVLCLATAERPTRARTVVAALLGAVMTGCHACSLPIAATVLWVVMRGPMSPIERCRRVIVVSLVFATATFAIAPLACIENLRFVFGSRPGGPLHANVAVVPSILGADPIARDALVAVGGWLLAMAAGWTRLRRTLAVPVAIVAPMLLAFALGLALGIDDGGGKYLAQIKPAAALGFAACAITLGRGILSWTRLLARVQPLAPILLPWATVLVLVIRARADRVDDPRQLPRFTMRDLDGFARILRDQRGWSLARAELHVRTPDSEAILLGLSEETGTWHDVPPATEDPTSAYLLKIDAAEVPAPLPAGWSVAHRTGSTVAVVVFARTALDWARATVCSHGPGYEGLCTGGDSARPASANDAEIDLRVPVLPGSPATIVMPRISGQCSGRIVALPSGGSTLEADGRRGIVSVAPDGASAEAELVWHPHTSDCPAYFGRLRPPFFLDGDDDTVALLESVLRRQK